MAIVVARRAPYDTSIGAAQDATMSAVRQTWRRSPTAPRYVHPPHVDLVHGTVHIHRSLRRYTHEEKQTKTRGTRRLTFEPTLRLLLEQMHRETGGKGRVLGEDGMPDMFDLANGLRVYLAMAGVDREELLTNDATRKWITFHDLWATGITWTAVRGDEPLRIKAAGGARLSRDHGGVHPRSGGGQGGVRPTLPRARKLRASADFRDRLTQLVELNERFVVDEAHGLISPSSRLQTVVGLRE